MRAAGPPCARLALALCASLASCAAAGSDIHLEPLFARHSMANGGTEVEALGGFYLSQDPMPTQHARIFGLRPLWSRRVEEDGDRTTNFLVPLGFDRQSRTGHTSMLLPFFYYQSQEQEPQHEGLPARSKWDLVALPGILWTRSSQGNDRWAIFPFGGRVNRLLTYDKIVFALFPLFLYTEREGVRSWHFLWPIFGWSSGPESGSKRFWPIFGHAWRDGRYDRWFWLWPFVHWHKEREPGTETLSATKFLLLPLYGNTQVGSYRSDAVLWPFFGYARDPRSRFWALDAPWPFVRIQGGGRDPNAEERTRVWPFYSHFRSDRLHADSYLWPFVHVREERYVEGDRDATFVVPFWQSWDRKDKLGGPDSSWRKLWPLYQDYREGAYERYALPALNPFWRSELIDYHFAWLWELYMAERGSWGERERFWGGLFRREAGKQEQRVALSALWAERSLRDERGPVTERSFLFGLLRWRQSARDGFQMMKPAFPGPGWPPMDAPEPLEEPRGASAQAFGPPELGITP